MATKKNQTAKDAPKGDPRNTVQLKQEDFQDMTEEQVRAYIAQAPTYNAAFLTKMYSAQSYGPTGITEGVQAMRKKVEQVQAGNLSGLEEMLTAQAVALNAIFTECARRASLNMGEYMNAAELYLRLGMKAQGQCRATLQTLAEIKNPRPVAFVKQANIAHGPQQVNNGPATGEAISHARELGNQANKLSGGGNELLPDARAPGIAGEINSPLETVGAVHRAAH